jgi:membrane fusion protein, multidrug efflux system
MSSLIHPLLAVAMTAVATFLAGCDSSTANTAPSGVTVGDTVKGAPPGDQAKKGRSGPAATVVTLTKAGATDVEVTEETVGSLEDILDPRISAEIPGRITRLYAEVGTRVRKGQLLAELDVIDIEIQSRSDRAEIGRLEALLENQERIATRNMQLVDQNFISRNALDESIAQRNALREQLSAAKTKLEATGSSLRKSKVLSPIDGRVEELLTAVGNYVKLGDPMFRLVGTQKMRAHLPFPESASPRLKVGAPVRLSSPLVPNKVISAQITEIRPSVTTTSRALNVIVAFENDGSFRGGGTVNASIVTSMKSNIIMVPEQSVVLRPAGRVVYTVVDGRATQKVVDVGIRKNGMIEIVGGLEGGETLALDGAGFLTNGAAIQVARAPGGAGKSAGTDGNPASKSAIPAAAAPADDKGSKGGKS